VNAWKPTHLFEVNGGCVRVRVVANSACVYEDNAAAFAWSVPRGWYRLSDGAVVDRVTKLRKRRGSTLRRSSKPQAKRSRVTLTLTPDELAKLDELRRGVPRATTIADLVRSALAAATKN
jgi:hypothetical protein